MRPDYARDAPPTTITVGGADYPVETDFRVWIDVTRKMRDLIPAAETEEQFQHNEALLGEIQTAVFGGVLEDEHPADVMRAVAKFAAGYPGAPTHGEARTDAPVYSFEYDLNYIILAIRNQSGIDLSYRRKEPFHWWAFLLEFGSLCGEHYILRLMEIRGYTGKDPEMRRMKARLALPRELTGGEKAALDEINEEFYNA